MRNMHEIASKLVEIQMQLRFFHWQTNSYAQHMAFGSTYDAMDDLIDSFVETMMGKYGKAPALPVKLYNKTDKDCGDFTDETIKFLISITGMLDQKTDSDLLNIRDEMLHTFNKLKYLLTLK